MQRLNVVVLVLVILAVLFVGGSVFGNKVPVADRPGDATYTATKLEWAALELQANYGSHLTSDTPMAVSFAPEADGQTILCLLQFTPDMPPELVKSTRYTRQVIFDKYVQRRGWSWLRLEFQEQTMPRPSRAPASPRLASPESSATVTNRSLPSRTRN
jgi:hypothetical protein